MAEIILSDKFNNIIYEPDDEVEKFKQVIRKDIEEFGTTKFLTVNFYQNMWKVFHFATSDSIKKEILKFINHDNNSVFFYFLFLFIYNFFNFHAN